MGSGVDRGVERGWWGSDTVPSAVVGTFMARVTCTGGAGGG